MNLYRLDKLVALLYAWKDVKDFVIEGDFNWNVLNCTPKTHLLKDIAKLTK